MTIRERLKSKKDYVKIVVKLTKGKVAFNINNEIIEYNEDVSVYDETFKMHYDHLFNKLGIAKEDFNKITWGFVSGGPHLIESNRYNLTKEDFKYYVLNVKIDDIINFHSYDDWCDYLFEVDYKEYTTRAKLDYILKEIKGESFMDTHSLIGQDIECLFKMKKSDIIEEFDTMEELMVYLYGENPFERIPEKRYRYRTGHTTYKYLDEYEYSDFEKTLQDNYVKLNILLRSRRKVVKRLLNKQVKGSLFKPDYFKTQMKLLNFVKSKTFNRRYKNVLKYAGNRK